MTDLTELLADCKSRGIVSQAHGNSLVIDAPERELTADLLTAIQDFKPAILAVIAHQYDETPFRFVEGAAAESTVDLPILGVTAKPVDPWRRAGLGPRAYQKPSWRSRCRIVVDAEHNELCPDNRAMR